MRRVLNIVLGALVAVSGQVLAASQTRTTAYEYDASTGLLTKEIIEPDDSALCLVTAYVYGDGFGNRTSATTRNCDHALSTIEAAPPTGSPVFTSRTSTTSYAANTVNLVAGQFPTSSTNALGHTETRVFDASSGAVTKLTGPNGLITQWTYDGFDRKVSEIRADGTTTTWTYTNCGTCPANGVYYVTETTTGAPTKNRYYDSLNREIQSEVDGFDGTTLLTDTQYNALGQVSKVSKPYKPTQTPAWTVYTTYDILGRVTRADEPTPTGGSGGGVRTATGYDWPTTTVTVSNAGGTSGMPSGAVQTRATTKDALGQVITVTDTQSNTVQYTYNPFGHLLTTVAGGVTTTLTVDLRGRKTAMADKDMGTWTYIYNALGELVSQTDAKSQTTTMVYDKLGRMTNRTDTDLTSNWTYDSCTMGIGKLCTAVTTNGAINDYTRAHTYDSLGRQSSVSVTILGIPPFTTTTTYDSSGRLDTLTYPGSTFAVKHIYNSYGYLWKVQRVGGGGVVFWRAVGLDAAGNIKTEVLGNGLTTSRTYDRLYRVTAISATDGTLTPHSQTFAYDALGNISQRVDAAQSPAVTENFVYDTLNRLTYASGSGTVTRTIDYSNNGSDTNNAIGNIRYKSDTGNYTYLATGNTRPHSVSSVARPTAASGVTATYTYDANGSLTAVSGNIFPTSGSSSVGFTRSLSYKSFNMPDVVTHAQGGNTYTSTYKYSVDHERVVMNAVRPGDTITTYYIHPGGKGAMHYEKDVHQDGSTEEKYYVNGDSGHIGVFVIKTGAAPEMRYYHRDNLGSIAVITNETGDFRERLAYEPFGERRNVDGSPENRTSPIYGLNTERGYTAHEHLDDMMLIHMNGRIYDPVLARFMTADPFMGSAADLQNFNRYSYANNNPLAYTDPTGYFKIGDLFKAAAAVVIAIYAPELISEAYVGQFATFEITASITNTAAILGGAVGGFGASFIGSGGNLETGLKGAISGGLFGFASGIGSSFSSERLLAHAGAGCIQGAMMGGGCGRGAASAVAGKTITELSGGNPVAAVVAGGTASVIGGGKFANGAITSAFGYLFNHCQTNCLTMGGLKLETEFEQNSDAGRSSVRNVPIDTILVATGAGGATGGALYGAYLGTLVGLAESASMAHAGMAAMGALTVSEGLFAGAVAGGVFFGAVGVIIGGVTVGAIYAGQRYFDAPK